MSKELRKKVIVKEGGLIELVLPELAEGTSVDVIVLEESREIKPLNKHPLSNFTKKEQIAKIHESLGGWEDEAEITAIFSDVNQKRHAYHGRPLVSFDD